MPLFVEELTKTVLESGLLARRRRPLRAGRPAAAARDPGDPARLADGAPRPPGAGQGGGADRRGDRPRVPYELLAAVADLLGAASSATPSTSWSPPSWSSAAARRRSDLHLQARAGAGRGLRQPAQEPAPAAPRAHRPGARGTLPGRRRDAARAARASLTEAGLTDKARRLLAQGRAAGGRALGHTRRRSLICTRG